MIDSLEQKIDMLLVVMGKLLTKDDGQDRQFKSLVYQTNNGRGQTKQNNKQ